MAPDAGHARDLGVSCLLRGRSAASAREHDQGQASQRIWFACHTQPRQHLVVARLKFGDDLWCHGRRRRSDQPLVEGDAFLEQVPRQTVERWTGLRLTRRDGDREDDADYGRILERAFNRMKDSSPRGKTNLYSEVFRQRGRFALAA